MLIKLRNKNLHLVNKLQSKYLFVFCFFIVEISGYGQCAMCRASLQSEANQATAEGVNNGIVYLMALPYILVAAAFYGVYLIQKKKKENKNPDAN